MIAAIYARKSTEQNGADADAKSVARQVENARGRCRRGYGQGIEKPDPAAGSTRNPEWVRRHRDQKHLKTR